MTATRSFVPHIRSPTAAAAWVTSRPSTAPIPVSRSRRIERKAGTILCSTTRDSRCCCGRQAGLARRRSRKRRSIRIQDSSPIRSTRSSRTCRCRTHSRTRPAGSARSTAALRSRSATSGRDSFRAGPTTTSTRSTSRKTGSSTSSAWRRRTCRPTSPLAGATPSPIPARPEPRRCRSSLALTTRSRRPMRAIPPCIPARTGPIRPSSGSSRCITRIQAGSPAPTRRTV